jgi:hypothetical protein
MSEPRVNAIIAEHKPVEQQMAFSIVRRSWYVGAALIAIFGLVRGRDGALAAGLGVLIVVVYYVIAGVMLSRSARISLSAYYSGALFGYFVRLGLITGTLLLVARAFEVDRFALGISVVATYMTLLTLEAVAISNRKKRD